MLAPLDRSAIFLGKMVSNLILIGLVECLTMEGDSIGGTQPQK